MNNINGSILLSLSREDFLCLWPPLVGEVPWEHINFIKNQTTFPAPNHVSEPSVSVYEKTKLSVDFHSKVSSLSFCQKSNFFVKNRKFWKKSKFSSKIEIFVKKSKFLS